MLFIIKPIWAVVTALVMAIVGIAENPLPPAEGENCILVGDENYMLEGYLLRAQDVTTDGTYYYFSSNFFLYKTTLDGISVKKNLFAIPMDLLLEGLNHIGGISYAGGKIYAALESNPGFERSCVIVYDANTLKPTGERLLLPGEDFVNGIPWVAADPERGVLYCLKSYTTCTLNAYSLDGLQFAYDVDLSHKQFSWIQGGDMYQGKLYLSCNTQNTRYKQVWAVDVETGECRVAFERDVGAANVEAEGLTALATPDGAVFHIVDAGKLKLNVHFRHYAMK